MGTIVSWLKESNHYKHLLYGIIIGVGSDNWYCAEYTGIGIASALELKDKMHGGKFDWVDLSLTVIGVNIGFGVKFIIIN